MSMAKYNYAFQGYQPEHMARALGRDLSISTKQSIELCKFLKHKSIQTAKSILKQVIEKKRAVPYTRFTGGTAHRKGNMAGGKYPINTANAFLAILEGLEANAQQKGLNTANLKLIHVCAQQASLPHHFGRFRGRKMKRSHVEIVAAEQASNPAGQKQPSTEKAKQKKETKGTAS